MKRIITADHSGLKVLKMNQKQVERGTHYTKSQVKPFQCKWCKQRFRTFGAMRLHQQYTHIGDPPRSSE